MQYLLEKPVQGTIGTEKYQCAVTWRNGNFIADEPETSGGRDTGPDPYTLMLASLATCTLVTMRMYIERKAWSILQVTVHANMYYEIIDSVRITVFERNIIFPHEVEEDQKKRLLEIAEQCPISKILRGPTRVHTKRN